MFHFNHTLEGLDGGLTVFFLIILLFFNQRKRGKRCQKNFLLLFCHASNFQKIDFYEE